MSGQYFRKELRQKLLENAVLPRQNPWIYSVGDDCAGYRVLSHIGRGGYGQVYRVRGGDGRERALKVMRLSSEADHKHGYRFIQEARIIRDLDHAHVVRFHDFGVANHTSDGAPAQCLWMVMELLPGYTLRRVLVDHIGLMDLERALWLVEQAAHGIAAAHAAGVVHRDIKPENLMVLPGDVVKVIDFGIAKRDASRLRTTKGNLLGTALYMAPDHLLNDDADFKDPRWDIYSMGVVLWELLEQRHPFEVIYGELPSIAVTIAKHIHGDIPRLDSLAPEYPVWLSDLVADATARDPASRIQTMTAFLERLAITRRRWCDGHVGGPSTMRPSDLESMVEAGFRRRVTPIHGSDGAVGKVVSACPAAFEVMSNEGSESNEGDRPTDVTSPPDMDGMDEQARHTDVMLPAAAPPAAATHDPHSVAHVRITEVMVAPPQRPIAPAFFEAPSAPQAERQPGEGGSAGPLPIAALVPTAPVSTVAPPAWKPPTVGALSQPRRVAISRRLAAAALVTSGIVLCLMGLTLAAALGGLGRRPARLLRLPMRIRVFIVMPSATPLPASLPSSQPSATLPVQPQPATPAPKPSPKPSPTPRPAKSTKKPVPPDPF